MAQINLNDPILDAKDNYTKMFLAAEYWKKKCMEARELSAKEIAELKNQAKHWEDTCHAQWENHQGQLERLNQRIVAQQGFIAKLKTFIAKYAEHDEDCTCWTVGKQSIKYCTCGMKECLTGTDLSALEAHDAEYKRQIAELREDLQQYGRHQNNELGMCDLLKHSDYSCTCGFDKALANTSGE